MKTLASAGFTFLLKFIWFALLGIIVNIILTFVYMGNISTLFSGEHVVLGSITLLTVIVFPFIWLFMAKKEAMLSATFKVVDKSMDELVGFIIDKFVTENNKDKLGDYMGILEKQPKITQMILGFFFEKVDFFTDVSRLLQEKDYSNEELKVKMVETTREKELFEEWQPTIITPIFLVLINVGILYIANIFL